MRILNFGSLNIDHVYSVDHFLKPGETAAAKKHEMFLGGKGLNQSIAAARAGGEVYHAGAVGTDGQAFCDLLKQAGVHTDYLRMLKSTVSGHAVIQVVPQGQNCIIVEKGANGEITENDIQEVVKNFQEGDLLLLQNEISNVAYAMKCAREHGLKVAFNPSPITEGMFDYPLECVDYFILNEVEGQQIAETESESYEEVLQALQSKFPEAVIMLTLGTEGCLYCGKGEKTAHKSYQVKAVDTTGAGDTFCGYFLAGIAKGLEVDEILMWASKASAMAVSKKGAANSIPTWEEVEHFQEESEESAK